MSVGSAINDTTRVAGGALGVAVLGSLLASGYRGGHGLAVAGLPAHARDARATRWRARWPWPRTAATAAARRGRAGRVPVRHAHRGARRGARSRSPARSSRSCCCLPARRARERRAPEAAAGVSACSHERDRRAPARAAALGGGRRGDPARGARAARRGRLPRADDGAGARALRRRQGDALPPLRLQGGARARRRSCTSTRTSRCPRTRARCRATSRRTAQTVLAGAARTGALTLMPRLLSEVAGDPEMHALFSEHLVRAAAAASCAAIVERAKARGEIRADVDIELAVDLMVGPIIYRLIISGGDLERRRRPRPSVLERRAGRAQASLTCTRPPSPTPSVRRPASSSSSSAPTSSRRQPRSVRTSGSGCAAAGGDDDRREVGARGDQLVGEPGLLRAACARATRRARSSGPSTASVGERSPSSSWIGSASRPRSIAAITSSPRRRTTSGVMPRICASSRRPAGWRLASSTTVGSRRTAPTGRSSRGRGALAPGGERAARRRARAGRGPLTRGSRRQTSSGSRSSVASAIATHSSRAHSSRPRSTSRALDVVGQRQQVLDVAARVADLLVGQRPRVPAREARGLRQPDPQHVVQQAVVARLRGEAGEARRDLRVEDVRERRLPLAAQDRDVLAAGVQRRSRSSGRRAPRPAAPGSKSSVERVEHLDLARRPRSAPGTAAAGSGPPA